jgi:predicted nucleotidyltransferase
MSTLTFTRFCDLSLDDSIARRKGIFTMYSAVAECLRIAAEKSISRKPFVGVLMYGSRANRPGEIRPDSDVDLMCFVDDDLDFPAKIFADFDDLILDIYYTTEQLARKSLNMNHKNNTHYVLNALTDGVIVEDRNNSIKSLVADAHKIKASPPPLIGLIERRNLELQTDAALRRIHTLLNQETLSEDEAALLAFRCNTQFHITAVR